ncbi:hypothetical protein Csa_002817, partial [Cucumis sativus]
SPHSSQSHFTPPSSPPQWCRPKSSKDMSSIVALFQIFEDLSNVVPNRNP